MYIAAINTAAPANPANISGRQSKTKIAIELSSNNVPYQRKAWITVLTKRRGLNASRLVTNIDTIDMVNAML